MEEKKIKNEQPSIQNKPIENKTVTQKPKSEPLGNIQKPRVPEVNQNKPVNIPEINQPGIADLNKKQQGPIQKKKNVFRKAAKDYLNYLSDPWNQRWNDTIFRVSGDTLVPIKYLKDSKGQKEYIKKLKAKTGSKKGLEATYLENAYFKNPATTIEKFEQKEEAKRQQKLEEERQKREALKAKLEYQKQLQAEKRAKAEAAHKRLIDIMNGKGNYSLSEKLAENGDSSSLATNNLVIKYFTNGKGLKTGIAYDPNRSKNVDIVDAYNEKIDNDLYEKAYEDAGFVFSPELDRWISPEEQKHYSKNDEEYNNESYKLDRPQFRLSKTLKDGETQNAELDKELQQYGYDGMRHFEKYEYVPTENYSATEFYEKFRGVNFTTYLDPSFLYEYFVFHDPTQHKVEKVFQSDFKSGRVERIQ